MAQRRMFSLKVVDTDAFLDMPAGSQLLYFHLAMRADDDGFVANPKKIMRMINVNEDDMKILIAKKFILTFESGVIVIKHWRIHNYVQKDRYSETTYIKEKKQLKIKENNAYQKENDKYIQNVSKMDTQVRLGKDRIGYIKDQHPSDAISSEIEKKKQPDYSSECNEYCDLVYKRGLNIYGLLGKFRKQSKIIHPIPEEVIIEVCKSYLNNDGKIRKEFPYFLKILTEKSREWFAKQQIKEHEELKEQKNVMSIGEILAKAMGECQSEKIIASR